MKVLHVIPTIAHRDGGPSAAVQALARAQVKIGNDVTVATTNVDGSGELPVPLNLTVFEEGVRVRYFGARPFRSYKFSIGMTCWLIKSVSEYDVVHVHALFSYPTIPACRAAARSGVPFIVRPLGTLDPWSLEQSRWKKLPYLRFVERRHLVMASAIHATSEPERAAIDSLGYGAKTKVVPLGTTAPSGTRRRSPHPAGRFRVLFLSRLHPVKGLELLIEAVAKLRSERNPVDLIIAGSGPREYAGSLIEKVMRTGLREHVRFVGHVAEGQKTALFDEADMFVLPSYHENFGMAALEALAAGVPTVVSDQVGISSDVALAHAGLVVPCDAAAIAAAIARLTASETLRATISANGQALAQQRFTWDATARLMDAVYQEAQTGHAGMHDSETLHAGA